MSRLPELQLSADAVSHLKAHPREGDDLWGVVEQVRGEFPRGSLLAYVLWDPDDPHTAGILFLQVTVDREVDDAMDALFRVHDWMAEQEGPFDLGVGVGYR